MSSRLRPKPRVEMAPINYSVKDIENVVKFDGKVKNVEISRLTAPGENFVSLVLRIDFEVEKNGHSRTISSVAKRLPLNKNKNGFEMHSITMKNEIKWYSEILPILKNFGEENEIKLDFYPEHYGSRLSLDSSKNEADSNSVLFLENLISKGYQNGDRYIGYDLITSKAIIQRLAVFHALPIAMKIKKPEAFQIIKDYLDKGIPQLPGKNDSDGPGKNGKPPGPPPEAKRPDQMLLEELIKVPNFSPYITKIKPLIDKPQKDSDLLDSFLKLTKEPWNTIRHNDFWINNIMVNYSKGNEPLIKIIDFQMCTYGSYAVDLVFFLLISVRNDIVKEYMDDLLRFYYEEFTSVLRKTNVNLELTYGDFLEEVRTVAQLEFRHAFGFSAVIFGEKGTGIDVAVGDFDLYEFMVNMFKKISLKQIDKLVVIASEAIRRNWI